jgi:hypothetical protein
VISRFVAGCLLWNVSGAGSSFIFSGHMFQRSLDPWTLDQYAVSTRRATNAQWISAMPLNKEFSTAPLRQPANQQDYCLLDRDLGLLDSKVTCVFSFITRAYL